jgi:hypothetical protein
MPLTHQNCSNCFAAQPLSAKSCGMCGAKFGENRRDWSKVNRYKNQVLILTAIIPLLAWWILPVPYNPGYQLKRTFYTPSAICSDGIYSFSASRSGTCSNHGGVKQWLREGSLDKSFDDSDNISSQDAANIESAVREYFSVSHPNLPKMVISGTRIVYGSRDSHRVIADGQTEDGQRAIKSVVCRRLIDNNGESYWRVGY